MTLVTSVTTSAIPVFFATDDNFAPYLGVALKSLIENSSSENNYIIHILNVDLSFVYQSKLSALSTKNIEICFDDIKAYSEQIKQFKLPEGSPLSIATYFRLLIPLIYPQYKRLIYCDCDLIFKSDIADLYHQDPGENYFSGVPDGEVYRGKQSFLDYITNNLKIKDNKKYLNAGILVFNNEKIIKDKFIQKCFDTLERCGTFAYADQDIMNITAAGKVRTCPISFNYQWHMLYYHDKDKLHEVRLPIEDIKIIHYTAGKPWEYPEREMAEYFWEYARKSVFYEEIIFKNTNKSLLTNIRCIIRLMEQKNFKLQYWKFKLLSKIAIGKARKKFKQQYTQMKRNIKANRDYLEPFHKS